MTTPQRIVKLIPYGNPEDRLFAEIVVGGNDDLGQLADFVGWHLERFSVTTDIAGQATVTLADTPTDIDHVFLLTHEDERVLGVLGLAGADLTVQKRKLVYDKPDTPIGGAANAPGGVTIASSSGQSTGSTTATNNSTAASINSTTTTESAVTLNGDAAVFSGSGAGNALATGGSHSHTHAAHTHISPTHTHSQNAHSHTVDVLYDHDHALTFTSTSLAAAAAEATQLLVLYR